MADNLSISVTADTSKLRAQLAVAQADLRAIQTQVRQTATEFRKAGDDAKSGLFGQLQAQSGTLNSVTAQVRKYGSELRDLSGHTEHFNIATASAKRELIVLAHELSQGNFKQFGSSLMVLAERAGGLGQIISAMISPLGMMAAGALAAAGGIGYLAYQAYEAQRALKGAQAELLLTGRGGSLDDLNKLADGLADKFDIAHRKAAEMVATIAKAGSLTAQEIGVVAEMAVAEAKVREGAGQTVEWDEIGKKFADAFAKGAKGAIEFGRAFGIPMEEAERMLKIGDELGALSRALDEMKKHIESHGGAWAEAKARWDEYMRAIASSSAEGSVPNFEAFGPAPAMPSRLPSAGAGTGEVRHFATSDEWRAAIARGEKFEQFTIDEQRIALRGVPGMPQSLSEISGGRTGSAAVGVDRATRERTIKETERDYTENQVLARHSLEMQVRDAQAHYEEMRKLVQTRGKGLSEEEIEQQEEVTKARQERNQKSAALYDQETQLAIAKLKERQAATSDLAEKVRIQEQIVGLTANPAGAAHSPLASRVGAGGADQAQMEAARTELASLQRQVGQQSFQLADQGAAAMRHANADILKGYTAQQEEAVKLRNLNPFEAINNVAVRARELANENADRLNTLMAGANNVADRTKTYWQLWDEGVRAASEQQQLLKRRAEEVRAVLDKWAQPVKTAIDGIGSGIESALAGLLTKQKTWAQAMQDLSSRAVESLLSAAGSILSKIAAKSLGAAAGEGIGDFLGNQLMKSLGGDVLGLGTKAAEGAAFAAEVTAAGAGFTAEVTAAGAAFAAEAAAGGAAGGGGSALGAIGSIASVAALFYHGGIVPSAAGGWALPQFAGAQPAILHGGEMVLPNAISQGLQGVIADGRLGGGSPINLTIAAHDTRSGAQFIFEQKDAIARVLRSAVRSNANTLSPFAR